MSEIEQGDQGKIIMKFVMMTGGIVMIVMMIVSSREDLESEQMGQRVGLRSEARDR